MTSSSSARVTCTVAGIPFSAIVPVVSMLPALAPTKCALLPFSVCAVRGGPMDLAFSNFVPSSTA